MCFSATASFTATAILVPIGFYTSQLAWKKAPQYFQLAAIPVAFGMQQAFEGAVWLGLQHHRAQLVQAGSLGFLFFSHGFWLVWLPLSVLRLEQRPWAKQLLRVMACLGALFALTLYGPFLLSPHTFEAIATQGSINYQTHLIYDRFFSRDISRLIYLLLVLGPLWLCQHKQLQIFGGLVGLALVMTYAFYSYAFVSVWCFFAASLSVYIALIVRQREKLI